MSLVICDTNIFISVFRGIEGPINDLKTIGSENVLIPSVTVMELYRGMRNKSELAKMRKNLSRYNVVHYNEEVSETAVQLVLDYKLSHDLKIPDAIIGAMSIVYELPLYTYNLKDFKFIPGIKLYQ